MKLFEILKKIRDTIKHLLADRRGEAERTVIPDILCGAVAMSNILIGGVTYLVYSHFRKDTKMTAIDKVARLIDKDAKSS